MFILEVIVLPLRRFPSVSAKVGIFSVGIGLFGAISEGGSRCPVLQPYLCPVAFSLVAPYVYNNKIPFRFGLMEE